MVSERMVAALLSIITFMIVPGCQAFLPAAVPATTSSSVKIIAAATSVTTSALHAKKPNSNIRQVNSNSNTGGGGGGSSDEPFDGQVGTGPNWIERSFPVDITASSKEESAGSNAKELQKVEDYNLGISGISFQTDSLSLRMFDAIMSNSQFADNPDDDIRRAFTLYAMDFTAKEAVKAALKQNGLEIALTDGEEDESLWGDMDSIRLLTADSSKQSLPGGVVYDSTEDAIDKGGWTPGQAFDFVVRQVPAKIKELSLDELLQALDPKGELREQAKDANLTLPDEDIQSLADLANDSVRRSEMAPRGATTEEEAFAGYVEQRGYRPIKLSDLSNHGNDETKKHETTMHVMNALVAHGAIVVDMTDGGTTFDLAKQVTQMWNGIGDFYYNKVDGADDTTSSSFLPPMTTIMDTGSATAVAGYGSYDNDSLQFLETRRNRKTGELLPVEAVAALGEEATSALGVVFNAVSEAGKHLVQIAVAASSTEADAFSSERNPEEAAEAAAILLANELLDDGSASASADEFPICMSPHRLCRYTNNQQPDKIGDDSSTGDGEEEGVVAEESASREVFGAHLDSTWVTIVPVAEVSGLEVFDETEEEWYRPELAARKHWQKEQTERGEDPESLIETVSEAGTDLPWHSRYVVLMPGELLQIATRNEVPAAVHRVVATKNCPSRLSAPILLRCRPGVKMDVSRYLGMTRGDPLLEQCDGMTIEEIHGALQPTKFQ